MRKVIVILLFAMFAVVGLTCHSVVVKGQEKKEAATEKLGRWSGHIVRIDTENSFMDVRNPQGAVKRIYWDSETTWSKLNKPVTDHSEFKEEARVICLGKAGEKGKFMATKIDLRVHP
jgi:hypothetical protein